MVYVTSAMLYPTLTPRNVVCIVLDDCGVDVFERYGYADAEPTQEYVAMPLLDSWTRQGIQFEAAYGNPFCSPTRSLIQTGQYAFRTGLGHLVNRNSSYTLTNFRDFTSIPDALDEHYTNASLGQARAYNTSVIGKWHLGNETADGGTAAQTQAGYDEWRGVQRNLAVSGANSEGYYLYDWWKSGTSSVQTKYVTSYTVDQFIEWQNSLTPGSSYMSMVWFNAPHTPYDGAPAALHDIPGVDENTPWPGDPTDARPWFDAHMQALDKELDRLIRSCKACDTTFLVLGDNGTPTGVIGPPFSEDESKSTVYRGGSQIPLWVWGNSVMAHGVRCHQLIGAQDIWRTILDLCGVNQDLVTQPPKLDAISFAPYLADPTLPSQREFLLTETLRPTGLGPYTEEDWRAITDGRGANRDVGPRWRYLRRQGGTANNPGAGSEELYDLWDDPWERTDLSGALTPAQQAVFNDLSAQMDAILAS